MCVAVLFKSASLVKDVQTESCTNYKSATKINFWLWELRWGKESKNFWVLMPIGLTIIALCPLLNHVWLSSVCRNIDSSIWTTGLALRSLSGEPECFVYLFVFISTQRKLYFFFFSMLCLQAKHSTRSFEKKTYEQYKQKYRCSSTFNGAIP